MFCKYCGNELSEDAIFCTNCGAHVETSETNSQQSQTTETNSSEYSTAKENNATNGNSIPPQNNDQTSYY